MNGRKNNWLWYFFIIIGTGAVLSFSFVGKFNPKNKNQPEVQSIRMLWPEQDCQPTVLPCAVAAQDVALVVRIYPLADGVRLLVKTLGIEKLEQRMLEAVWVDQNGALLDEGVLLQPAREGGFTGDLVNQPAATSLRVSLSYGGHLLVADLPL